MTERSIVEQTEGLLKVAAQVPGAKLVWNDGDVPVVRLGNLEIAYVVGGYDLWVNGDLKRPNLSLENAIQALAT